jgi:hypothetical protein
MEQDADTTAGGSQSVVFADGGARLDSDDLYVAFGQQ